MNRGNSVRFIPNVLSLVRFALGPPFAILLFLALRSPEGGRSLGQWLPLSVLFAVICSSDLLDGFLARKFAAVSPHGAMLDIIADATYVFSSIIALSVAGYVPWWFLGVLILKLAEFLLTSRRGKKRGFAPVFDRVGRVAAALTFVFPGFLFAAVLVFGKAVWSVATGAALVITAMNVFSTLARFIKKERRSHETENPSVSDSVHYPRTGTSDGDFRHGS